MQKVCSFVCMFPKITQNLVRFEIAHKQMSQKTRIHSDFDVFFTQYCQSTPSKLVKDIINNIISIKGRSRSF